MSIFQHTHVEIPEGGFKISPSQISEFFSCPVCWYKSEVLGEKDFKNTSTHIGTAMHYIAEQYALSQINGTELDTDALAEKVEDDLAEVTNPDVDHAEVLSLYQDMGQTLINEYVAQNIPTEVEVELCSEIKDGVYLAGSCDNLSGVTRKYYCDEDGYQALSRL